MNWFSLKKANTDMRVYLDKSRTVLREMRAEVIQKSVTIKIGDCLLLGSISQSGVAVEDWFEGHLPVCLQPSKMTSAC